MPKRNTYATCGGGGGVMMPISAPAVAMCHAHLTVVLMLAGPRTGYFYICANADLHPLMCLLYEMSFFFRVQRFLDFELERGGTPPC